MVRLLLFAAILIFSNKTAAQKLDYNWVEGYDSYGGYYEGVHFGNTTMNFNYDPIEVTYDSLVMNLDKTNTSISDSNGDLLFYTNGIYIANSLNEKIENSDSLNAGWLQYVWDPTIETGGYRASQGIICISASSNKNQFYLIHSFLDSFNNSIICKKILATFIDVSLNNGLGQTIYKNQPVISDLLGWEISSTRHANGKDWWLLAQKRNSNCYYRILVDDTGLYVYPYLTCGGASENTSEIGASCFSPDGSKYIYLSYYAGLNIFDFDRCSGELSNAINIPLPIIAQNGWLGMGVAISPNNRFLYVSLTEQIYQFDLQATDIRGSIDTVGINDDSSILAKFAIEQLGPDGRIYISCGNSDTLFHVINNPDLKGDSCNFVQRGFRLASVCWAVPNYPNYRLGALTGSPCDTITALSPALSQKERELKVFPNPATDIVTIDYGFTNWSTPGTVSLEISNALGQVVYKQNLPQYSGYQKIDVTKYAAGLYAAYIKRNQQIIATQKFAKE